ncbi:MAG: hypothetical protein GQ570_01585 [Helicobacteraceae bacterium]|nr:hypothetical protein [Helicobacteraceae bacterium]
MIDLSQEIPQENLTQKDIMQFLLHSTQHVATREELQAVKVELKQEISDVRKEISDVKTELKQEISDVRKEISAVKTELKQDILKLSNKFDKVQWLIMAVLITVVLKDYVLSLLP